MRLNRGALKRQAREDMRRPRPPFWAVTLAYLGMTSGVALAVSLIPTPASGSGNGDFFLMILLNLYIGWWTSALCCGPCGATGAWIRIWARWFRASRLLAGSL